MQLDHLVGGHAGILMQVVDVLRDHRRDGATADQFGNGMMADVGLGIAEIGIDGELAPPRLTTHVFAGHEVLELDRCHLGPYPARAAKIRDTRLGRNPRPP